MKKPQILIPALCGLLLPLTTSTAHAADIDAGLAYDMGFGITALINDQVNITLGNDGIAGDYQFKKGSFESNVPFTWYVAGGAYNEWGEGFGARLPLGLNINFENNQQNWNAYTQVAPELGFDDDSKLKFSAQFAIGLRYSF